MPWYEQLTNPETITRLYRDPPSLSPATLIAIEMSMNRRRFFCALELPSFPDLPPPRWNRKDNTVAILLDFQEVNHVELSGEPSASVRLAADVVSLGQDQVLFTAQAQNFALKVKALAALIQKMDPYYVDPAQHSERQLPSGLEKYFTVQSSLFSQATIPGTKDFYPHKK